MFRGVCANFLSLKHAPMSEARSQYKKITTHVVQELYRQGEPISMLTAYDYSFAKVLDDAGIDVLLVGDSASNVMAGNNTTLPITLDQMIYHAKSVINARNRALVTVDLPFGSFQGSSSVALDSAIRMMKESGAHAIKLEGGEAIKPSVERIVSSGIPVMGHLGLTPQAINQFGSFGVRAKEEAEAEQVLHDARVLEQAGCFALVLEKVPADLSKQVTEAINIPTIGIGAGPHVSGQVLVLHDMLGMSKNFNPRFLRKYLNLYEQITGAVQQYIDDVKNQDFPTDEESY
jgi:3-methyl-2-oxobutanoate hydroxymethyltransferase